MNIPRPIIDQIMRDTLLFWQGAINSSMLRKRIEAIDIPHECQVIHTCDQCSEIDESTLSALVEQYADGRNETFD